MIGLSNSSSNPALSNVLITGGQSVMLFLILRKYLKKYDNMQYTIIIFLRKNWCLTNTNPKHEKTFFRNINNIWNRYALIVVTAGGFQWLFFAWAIQFIDIAIAIITVELHVVAFVLIHYLHRKKTRKGNPFSKSAWILFIFPLPGIIYITLSDTSVNQAFGYKGLLLLMVCVILSAIHTERSIQWGAQIYTKWQIQNRQNRQVKETTKEYWNIFILLGLFIGGIFAIILIILGSIVWAFQGNSLNLSFAPHSIEIFANELAIPTTVSWVICIAGGIVSAIGVWNLLKSNHMRYTPIRGILFLTPVLSLVWLFPFGLIQLQRWDYFVIGALIILATTVLISIEDFTGRFGFRWLIVSLWSTGLLIYFREKWILWPWLANNTPWEWDIESVDYYSLIVLSATIFILVLSFRTNRLVERTNKEEDQYLRMRNIIKNLAPHRKKSLNDYSDEKKSLNEEVDKLDRFDTNTDSEIRNRFVNIIISIRKQILLEEHEYIKQLQDLDLEDIKQLHDLELEFELLYRSKQRGRYLAENLVLYIFALVTIMVTIGTRPTTTSPWNALLIDILAFLFSAAICFTTINLIDLKAYREKSTAELIQTEEKGERAEYTINQRAVQVISIILAVVISISFVVLLYDKWMGIWFL